MPIPRHGKSLGLPVSQVLQNRLCIMVCGLIETARKENSFVPNCETCYLMQQYVYVIRVIAFHPRTRPDLLIFSSINSPPINETKHAGADLHRICLSLALQAAEPRGGTPRQLPEGCTCLSDDYMYIRSRSNPDFPSDYSQFAETTRRRIVGFLSIARYILRIEYLFSNQHPAGR